MNASEIKYMITTDGLSLADVLVIAELQRRDDLELELHKHMTDLQNQVNLANSEVGKLMLERDQLWAERDEAVEDLERIRKGCNNLDSKSNKLSKALDQIGKLEAELKQYKPFPNGPAEFYKRSQASKEPALCSQAPNLTVGPVPPGYEPGNELCSAVAARMAEELKAKTSSEPIMTAWVERGEG